MVAMIILYIPISLLQRGFESLFLDLNIHFQGQGIQLCHLPKCQMLNYLEKGENTSQTRDFSVCSHVA